MRVWLNEGVSDAEIAARLQARTPDFSLSPNPGGQWDWLLGALALVVASGVFVLLARRSIAPRRARPAAPSEDQHSEHWQDRLDDELLTYDA